MIDLIGIPYEGGENFLKGATLGPSKIRWALESLEVWSIYQNDSLPEYRDHGDFIPPEESPEVVIQEIEEKILGLNSERLAIIGGDHNITYPVIKALNRKDKNFTVVHIDAHLDMRESYKGNPFSHATVMRRIYEIVGEDRIISLGYRSIAMGEESPPKFSAPFEVLKPLKKFLKELNPEKIYLTIDLDVLDPSEFPAVSNPEPGGITFRELLHAVLELKERLIGFDIVEFNPVVFPGTYPAMTAATILRELLIALK